MNYQPTTQNPFTLSTMDDAERMAKWIADSGCYGITKPSQALTLMLIAREEGSTLSAILRKVHVFENGKLSQRADYTQSAFEQTGTILWHTRSPEMVAASFFKVKPIDDKARERAMKRFELQWTLDAMMGQPERDANKEGKLILELSRLAYEGEVTIIRTLADAEARGITVGKNGTKNNWAAGSDSMLQWRCVTDGVKLVNPAILSGLSSDVDLDDAKTVEQVRLVERASAPQSHDMEAMQLILGQHEQNALAATTESERKRYQGLAADMRITIQEAWDKEKPVKMSAIPVRESLRNPQSEKEEALLDEADDVPMTHATDPVNIVEAKVDRVEPPKKETRRVPEKKEVAAVPPTSEKQPEIKQVSEPVADLSKWADYKVHLTTSTAFHKQLSEFSQPEIAILYKKRSLPFLNSEDPALKLEAEMIRQAHDSK